MRRFPRRRGCKTNRRRRTPMAIVDRTKLLARPEGKKEKAKGRGTVCAVRSGGGLEAIADSFGEEVLVDGVPYRLHEPGSDTYHGLCGPLEIRRPTHRQVGVRNGPIVVAMELAAGLVEGATPALAYNVAQGYAQHDMRAH